METTAFGKAVKKACIDRGVTQRWLMEEVAKRTGLYVDSSVFSRIFTGQMPGRKVREAICEILDIEDA